MNMASKKVSKYLSEIPEEMIWRPEFHNVWEAIKDKNIWVLAIENSYMGSIHPNLYGFLKYDYKIIGELDLEINHCLCSKEKNIKNIKKAYSQIPALEQCYKYLSKRNIEPVKYSDTALSAKFVSESDEDWLSAICSEEAANIYGLNILDKKIQDNKGNTTRFAIIVHKNSAITYKKIYGKISILFEAKNIPASLYKCLGSFATNNVNLTKIESLPSFKWSFSRVMGRNISMFSSS